MTMEEHAFVSALPGMLPAYETLREALLAAHPDTTIRVAKTQITFHARYGYAFVSAPRPRRTEGMLVSFGLPSRLAHDRVLVAVEPYPGRWTHHVLCRGVEDIDSQLLSWLEAAYQFAQRK